ncbi:MAG: ABC transporter permease [Elusimicrobiota bacterium]
MSGPTRRKILVAVFTACVALVITFFLLRMMPGDIVHMIALELQQAQGVPYNEAYELAKAQLNYDPDAPVLMQFVKYLAGLAQGNMGVSIVYKMPVGRIILKSLPWTLFVCSLALLGSFTAGTLLGMIAARKRGSALDHAITLYATFTQAIPDFLIALLLLVVFSVKLRWFPIVGAYSSDTAPGFNPAFLIDALYHAVLPVSAFTLQCMGAWALQARAAATSTLNEDYVTVAKAKGLKERTITLHYVGRNAMLPLVTGLAISFGAMLGGSMFIEGIFNYPGIGFYVGQAIGNRDFMLIQGIFLMTTFAMIFAVLMSEFLYSLLDPRIKAGK